MEVIRENGKIKVKSDYNKEFIQRAKLIEGKWTAPYWSFPEENECEVKALLLEIYGENGDPQETVDILVDISEMDGESIDLCGRILCYRRFRDSSVTLAENVMLTQGGFPYSGGSMKHPRINPNPGTILKVKKCPVSVYERIKEMGCVTLCETKGTNNNKREALLDEKNRLLRRLEEIEMELNRE